MEILSNYSLKSLNTFGIQADAKYFAKVSDTESLKELLKWQADQSLKSLVLGGGSNVLFTGDFDGLVIRNELKGIELVGEDNEHIYLKVGAGEIWHEFVLYCLEHNYAGVENLALIPGFAGASPMQNIGAYGVEVKEVFHELTAMHRQEIFLQKFSAADCAFGYRESVFKHKYRDQFVITDITYRLNKIPTLHIEYGAIRKELERQQVKDPDIRSVANAVIGIRSSKLPDPRVIGNAGSFFKNPSVSKLKFQELKEEYPGLVAYENADGTMKLAAGWMIEQCGLKGFRQGDAGVHNRQALVLVNYGNARGQDLVDLSKHVQDVVSAKFGVLLVPEVNVI